MNTVNQLSPTNAAYIAGIVDGEGTITLIRKHKNENPQLSLSISSTECNLLEFILCVVGAGKITSKKVSKSNHAPSFAYAIYNRQALELIRQISPYLKTYKAQRAQLVIDNYIRLTPRNGKYSEKLLMARARFERQLLGNQLEKATQACMTSHQRPYKPLIALSDMAQKYAGRLAQINKKRHYLPTTTYRAAT